MKILIIADPHIPVPPKHYGGTERIVALYAEEFRRLGHTVHLMAGPDSMAYGGRLHIHRAPSLSYHSRVRRKIQFQLQSLLAARDCDVIYNHGRFDYLETLLLFRLPVLHCFHSPVSQAEISFAEARIKNRFVFQFLSKSQRSGLAMKTAGLCIGNFVDTQHFRRGAGSGGYLVFLGRLTKDKGVDIAIAVALQTGRKLLIAGNISNEKGGLNYFDQKVKPYLDGNQIIWVGPVDNDQKQDLLANADALLFPIRWNEPFGIVMIEALACGTPVIATNRASAPEVIQHGLTGFLCDPTDPSVDSFAEAVNMLQTLKREDCRRDAETRFDVQCVAPRVLDALTALAERQ